MKKIILLIALIFIVTGCTNTITYEFTNKGITSTIEMEFTKQEFEDYYSSTGGHSNQHFNAEESIDDLIEKGHTDLGVMALEKNSNFEYYNSIEYKKENGVYKYIYDYDFTYDNFKDNYYLNDCFEFFSTSEDDNYYHYRISGNFTCDNLDSFEIKVKADNRTINSNSEEIEDDIHTWNIEKEDNEITFSIAKEVGVSKSKTFSTIQIIGLFLLIILVVLSFVFYKFTKRNA